MAEDTKTPLQLRADKFAEMLKNKASLTQWPESNHDVADHSEYNTTYWTTWRRKPGEKGLFDPGEVDDDIYPGQRRSLEGPPLPFDIGETEAAKVMTSKMKQAKLEAPIRAAQRERLRKQSELEKQFEQDVFEGDPNGRWVSPRDIAAQRYGGYGSADDVFENANKYGANLDRALFTSPVRVRKYSENQYAPQQVPAAEAWFSPDTREITLMAPKIGAVAHELSHAAMLSPRYTKEEQKRFYEKIAEPGETYGADLEHKTVRGELVAESIRGLKDWLAARGIIPKTPEQAIQGLELFMRLDGLKDLRDLNYRVRPETYHKLMENPKIGHEIIKAVQAPSNAEPYKA